MGILKYSRDSEGVLALLVPDTGNGDERRADSTLSHAEEKADDEKLNKRFRS